MSKKNKKSDPIIVIILFNNLRVSYIDSKDISRYLDNKDVAYFLLPVSISNLSVYAPVKRKRLKSLCEDFSYSVLKYAYMIKHTDSMETDLIVDDKLIDVTHKDPIELFVNLYSLKRMYSVNADLNPIIQDITHHIDIHQFELTIFNKEGNVIKQWKFKYDDEVDDSYSFIFEIHIMEIIGSLKFMKFDFNDEISGKNDILGINTDTLTWGIYRNMTASCQVPCNIHGVISPGTESIFFFDSPSTKILSYIRKVNMDLFIIESKPDLPFNIDRVQDPNFHIWDYDWVITESQYTSEGISNFVYIFDIYQIFLFMVNMVCKSVYDSKIDYHLYIDCTIQLTNEDEFRYIIYNKPDIQDLITEMVELYL